MKNLRNIFNVIFWSIVGTYMFLSILLYIPAIQQMTGRCVAGVLCDMFGTKVTVGNINLGFFNRVIIDDFNMLDKDDKPMLRASRLSVNISLLELAEGKISISSAQIFGLHANIYKKNAKAQLNCQFVVDSLSAGGSEEKTPLDLRINSFIMRHGEICYNRLDAPYTNGKLNGNHINLSDISSHIVVKQVTGNSIDLNIKKLSLKDGSGLYLKNLSFALNADRQKAELKDFRLELPHSTFFSDSIKAMYRMTDGVPDVHTLSFNGTFGGRSVTLSDFSFLVPALKDVETKMNMNICAVCTDGKISINRLNLATADNSVRLQAAGSVFPFGSETQWNVRLNEFYAQNKVDGILSALGIKVPAPLDKIEEVLIKGVASGRGSRMMAKMDARSNLGDVSLYAEKDKGNIEAKMATDDFKLGALLDNDMLDKLNATVTARGLIKSGSLASLNINGDVKNIDYNRYSFKNILIGGSYKGNSISAQIEVKDPNCTLKANGNIKNISAKAETTLTATIERINPKRINLSDKWGDALFSASVKTHSVGTNMKTLNGTLELNNLHMASADKDYRLEALSLSLKPGMMQMLSDFGRIDMNGTYDFSGIAESVAAIVKKRLPTMPGLTNTKHTASNKFTLSAEIQKTDWIETLLGVPFHSEQPISVYAFVNDESNMIDADVRIPSFWFNGSEYRGGVLNLDTVNDTLFANMNVRKMLDGGNDVLLKVKADAADNKLNSSVYIDYNTTTRIRGELNAQTQFYKDDNGFNTAYVNVKPSQISVKDTVWNVRPANIIYNEAEVEVEHFAIEHNGQHIKIDGTATKSLDDSICVDLKDVNVKYILDLVNFHSVEFSGLASGKAYLKSVLNNPDAYANLTVDKFCFQDGRMGKLFANVNFDKVEKQININAHADEENGAQTIIKGYVSPAKNYIDLGITAKNTNIEFLKSFCGSFMSDIKAHANGFAQVFGDLSDVNLQGKLVADGQLKISTLNTVYNLKNDTIVMVPDEIMFKGDTVTDRNGNFAVVRGALHHKSLTRLTFDLDIKADHFLCYDFHDYGNNTFYGTVYGSGNCSITGRPHEINFDINMTPHSNSFIEYNAATPDAISDQNFIKWNKHMDADSLNVSKVVDDIGEDLNDASDMNINFNVNVTPDFTLRVLMDKATGDKISLNGSGALKASYFNKGSFDMFGTYMIDHGLYNLTIQNIIKKDFKFQQGSSIVFGGNPFNALLNLKAVYPVNGVSLADLKIGNSFSSNNVRVDCIMNIGGTPESIRVDFDFDMPTVNNDAKQMVRSLINSEEELNQQVVYLLAIGRFITNDKNNSSQEDAQQSQTSLAMQSLLSGTISQQVNNILGSVVKTGNWNFGTNISTGTEGFNNAEYEGLLSGSLFSNRLLINGQFGYRDNPNTTTSFIGDFDVKYLLTPNGNMAIKVYNQTNDRYFTKSSLNTQGLGLIFKYDFNNWRDLWKRNKKRHANK